jgi:hypothetical protein
VYSTNIGIVFAVLFMKNPPGLVIIPAGSEVKYPNPILPIVLSYCTVSQDKLESPVGGAIGVLFFKDNIDT